MVERCWPGEAFTLSIRIRSGPNVDSKRARKRLFLFDLVEHQSVLTFAVNSLIRIRLDQLNAKSYPLTDLIAARDIRS